MSTEDVDAALRLFLETEMPRFPSPSTTSESSEEEWLDAEEEIMSTQGRGPERIESWVLRPPYIRLPAFLPTWTAVWFFYPAWIQETLNESIVDASHVVRPHQSDCMIRT
jgi:hypothetical protein